MSAMNLGEVRRRLDEIRVAGSALAAKTPGADYAAPHELEDRLFEDALRAIADGHSAPASLAAAVLESKGYRFPRHYA